MINLSECKIGDIVDSRKYKDYSVHYKLEAILCDNILIDGTYKLEHPVKRAVPMLVGLKPFTLVIILSEAASTDSDLFRSYYVLK